MNQTEDGIVAMPTQGEARACRALIARLVGAAALGAGFLA